MRIAALWPLLVFILLLAAPSWAAPQSGNKVKLFVEPTSVEVGEPFELVLEIEHDTGLVPVLPGEDAAKDLDPSWVFFELHRSTSRPSRAPGRSISRRAWSLASLEPGERRLPTELMVAVVPEETSVLSGASSTIVVRGVLAEDEDEPRPLRGFGAGFGADKGTTVARRILPWAVGAAVLFALGLAFFLGRRSGRQGAASSAGATPLERLSALEKEDVAKAQANHFELASLVRGAVDARASTRREGLTDEEWLEAIGKDAGITAEERDVLADFLARTDRVKYAGERPSEWAWREELERAHGLVAGSTGGATS